MKTTWGFLAAVAAACSSSGGTQATDPAGCTGKCDSVDSDLVAQPEVARCWVEAGQGSDPFFRVDQVFCQWSAVHGDLVTERHLTVNMFAKDHAQTGGAFLDRQPAGTPQRIMGVRADQYPVGVKVEVDESWPSGLEGNFPSSLTLDLTIADATDTGPKLVKLPYDLWRVELIGRTRFAYVTLDPVSIPLAPFRGGSDASETTFTPRAELPIVRAGGTVEGAFAVPHGTTRVTGSAQLSSATKTAVTLDGPGAYVATDEGLQRATAADLQGTPDAGVTPGPSAPDAPPAVDPTPTPDAAPAPTCGVAGLSCCGGYYGTCEAGNNCSGGTCAACGTDGKACCGGYYGTCETGNNCGGGTCSACGTSGKACCGGYYGTCSGGLKCGGGSCQ